MYTICQISKGIVGINPTSWIFLKTALTLQVLPTVMIYAKVILVAQHLSLIPTTNPRIVSCIREGLTFKGKISASIKRATLCP